MKLFFLTVAILTVLFTNAQVVDKTRLAGAKGSDVVLAVVNLIRNACIFPNDKLYLRRLAYVASQDGIDVATFRPGYYGGIWQIDQNMFQQTQTAQQLDSAKNMLKMKLGIDWSKVKWTDLTKPLYSGLAAAMYLFIKAGDLGPPGGIEYQATFWKNTTGPGHEASIFYNAASKLETGCKRSDNLDLVFVVDSSASLSSADFDSAKYFIRTVLDTFNIAPNATRVAVVKYSTLVTAEFFLNDFAAKAAVLKAIEGIKYESGGTKTAEAIDFTVKNVFTESNGARRGSAKVLILITDGRSENTLETVAAAAEAKANGITMFTIGVTARVDESELKQVASLPTCTHEQTLNAFSDLSSLKSEIQQVSCEAPAVLTPNNYSFPCGQNINVQILPEVGNGSTVTVSVNDGSVAIYGSTSYTASPVLNEFYRLADLSASMTFYISGSQPVSLAFVSSSPGSCNSNFHVDVFKGDRIPTGSHVLCIEGTLIQNCSTTALQQSPYLTLPTGPGFPNPCTRFVGIVQIFAYPTRNDRFIYCDELGNPFIVLCPLDTYFDPRIGTCLPGTLVVITTPSVTVPTMTPRTTQRPITLTPSPSPGTVMNPCTPENIIAGFFFFEYPGNKQAYIECYNLPYVAAVKLCPEHHYWSQKYLTCLYDDVVVDPTKQTYHTNANNPCNTIPDLFFYPIAGDETRYIHCDDFGDAFEKTCPDQKIWSQPILQCVPRGLIIYDTVVPPLGKK